MKKACVAIGVDLVAGAAGLARLNAAAKGAKRFAEWAESQGYSSVCFTDSDGPVAISSVKKHIRALVEQKTWSQLVIFFAGHGLLKAADTELWLLSDAANDTGEAINLVGSIRQARFSGIPHVVFISDACRSLTSDSRLTQAVGGELFPIGNNRQTRPEVDVFYATLPADPSFELPPDKANAAYRGIFTECLLKGLGAPEQRVCEYIVEGTERVCVVSSRTLKPWLEAQVPAALSDVDIGLDQVPELRVESQMPKYLARVERPPEPVDRTFGAPSVPGEFTQTFGEPVPPLPRLSAPVLTGGPGSSAPLREIVLMGTAALVSLKSFLPKSGLDLLADVQLLVSNVGRHSVKQETGFTISGAVPVEVFCAAPDVCSISFGSGTYQVRITSTGQPSSVVIRFEGGFGTCLAAFPGYIGTVTVEDGRVVNVSYAPSQPTKDAKQNEERRSLAAAATRRGAFDARAVPSLDRLGSAPDPTLGIYSAYAYDRANLQGRVRDVYGWLKSYGMVPFDVALLADLLEEGGYSPFAPMLTQGWSLLHEELPVPGWLLEARRFTVPALWTTLSAEGVDFVAKHIR